MAAHHAHLLPYGVVISTAAIMYHGQDSLGPFDPGREGIRNPPRQAVTQGSVEGGPQPDSQL